MTNDTVDKRTLVDMFFKMYQEHCTHARHHETQRSTVSTILLAIAAGVMGLVKYDEKIDSLDFPLSIFLIVLGLFGALFCLKQSERFRLHTDRAKKYREAVDELLPDRTETFLSSSTLFELPKEIKESKPSFVVDPKPIKAFKSLADKEHEIKYPIWSKTRLITMWAVLHLLVAILGIVMAVTTRPDYLR